MAMKSRSTTSRGPSYYRPFSGDVQLQYFDVGREVFTVRMTAKGNYRDATGHAYTKESIRGYTGVVRSIRPSVSSERRGAQPYVYNAGVHLDLTHDYEAFLSATSKYYEKLRGTVDISVDAFQWRQVVRLVSLHRTLARTLSAAASDARKRIKLHRKLQRDGRQRGTDFDRARWKKEVQISLDRMAAARLSYVYGLKPTMDTIRDVVKLAGKPRIQPIKVEARGFAQKVKTTSDFSISSRVPVVHVSRKTSRCLIVGYYTPNSGLVARIGAISSFNPISVAYELMPFSFVVDWVYNIGGWLRDVESAYMYSNAYVKGFTTRTTRVTLDSRMNGNDFPSGPLNPQSVDIYNLSGSAYGVSLDRGGLATPPVPLRPKVEIDFGLTRTMNAAALAWVVLRQVDDFLKHRR